MVLNSTVLSLYIKNLNAIVCRLMASSCSQINSAGVHQAFLQF